MPLNNETKPSEYACLFALSHVHLIYISSQELYEIFFYSPHQSIGKFLNIKACHVFRANFADKNIFYN